MTNNIEQSSQQDRPVQPEAIYESSEEDLLAVAESRIKKEPSSSAKLRKKLILISLGVLVLIGALIAAVVFIRRGRETPEPEPGIEMTDDVDLTSLQQQVKALGEELEAADPSDKETPFPNVDMDIRVNE